MRIININKIIINIYFMHFAFFLIFLNLFPWLNYYDQRIIITVKFMIIFNIKYFIIYLLLSFIILKLEYFSSIIFNLSCFILVGKLYLCFEYFEVTV
jgi:hypothetical protein